MAISKKLVLLTTIGALVAGCGPSGGSAGQPKPVSSTPTAAAATSANVVAKAGLQSLPVDQLKAVLTATPISCNIEAMGKVPFSTIPLEATGTSVSISGWILSDASKRPGVSAQLRFLNSAGNEGWQLPIDEWNSRPDVISTMHAVDSGNVGFAQTVELETLPPGKYRVVVTFQDAGKSYSCDKGRVIEVR